MKEWFTNAELANLKLPAFPATEPGVSAWMKRQRIDNRFPEKVRRRQGQRGGGLERHISILPDVARKNFTVGRLCRDAVTVASATFVEATAPKIAISKPLPGKGDHRRTAQAYILDLFKVWHRSFGGPVKDAQCEFARLYNNRDLADLPGWVLEAKPRLSRPTLERWRSTVAKAGLAGLGDKYGARKGTSVLETANGGLIADKIAAYIVKQPHLTARQIRRMIKAEFGDVVSIKRRDGEKVSSLPNERAFQRFMKNWKSDHEEALLKLTDPDKWRRSREVSGTNMYDHVERPNELWEIDASPADVLCVDGRYSIYLVIDIATRRVKILVSRTPTTEASLLLVRKAIQSWGVPDVLRTDNGSDFISYRFKSGISAIGVSQDICGAFSPKEKAAVERAIGTMQRDLMPLLPGFIGHNVTDRKKIEARKSFAQRLGCDAQKAFCVEMTADELQRYCDDWAENVYAHEGHGSLNNKTPFDAATSFVGAIRRIENPRVLDILLAEIPGGGTRRVTATGLRIDGARFMSPMLLPGSTVQVRHDPQDMGRVYCFSEDGVEFIAVAECPERTGADPKAMVAAAKAEQKRRIRDEVDPLQRAIRAIKPRDMIDMTLKDANDRTGNITAFPRPTERHSTSEIEAAQVALQPTATHQSAEDEAKHKAFEASLAQDNTNVVALPETAKDRFLRAMRIEEMITNKEQVDTDDAVWLGRYQTTSEYRASREIFEEFGPDWLEI